MIFYMQVNDIVSYATLEELRELQAAVTARISELEAATANLTDYITTRILANDEYISVVKDVRNLMPGGSLEQAKKTVDAIYAQLGAQKRYVGDKP